VEEVEGREGEVRMEVPKREGLRGSMPL